MTVGEAVAEPLAVNGLDDADRRERIVADLLERVGLSAGDADRYPHEFSGGEKQRIAIARALVLDPDLLVADEPTSALDARVQADVLSLLDRVRREFDVAVLLVSHDIDTVRRFCDRVAVMYLGELVERGPVEDVLADPAHPYTRVLVGSVPALTPGEQSFAQPLTDAVPDPSDPPTGCRFHTRCPDLIAPDDVDLPAETWRAVARLRFGLRTGELPAAVDAAADGGRGSADVRETVREAFGLPDPVPDEAVETAVTEAIAALADGDRERAADRLAAATPTVCERETPATVDHDGRRVRCHRHDPDIEAGPGQHETGTGPR
jgi:peptide/nickel transport system ATP-binding protein